ncbi:MAG: hypothetical protein ACKOBW_10905 [Planctomycetota bacterium]
MQLKLYLMYGAAVTLIYGVVAWNGWKLPALNMDSGPNTGSYYGSGSNYGGNYGGGLGGGHYSGSGSGNSSGWSWGK